MSDIKNAIFGVCPAGLSIKNIMQNSGLSTDCFVDNDLNKQTNCEGIEVISPNKLFELDKEYKTNIYISAKAVTEIVLQLKNAGFKGNVYGIKKRELDSTRDISEYVYKIDINKPQLSYIEYEVTRHCNLKCKGCTHFSNLEKQQTFGNVDIFYKDLQRLKELFWGIKKIRLLGGEPLLNHEFQKFYRIAREIFPDARIQVVTNGLLIPGIDGQILDEMKLLQIEFDITQYIPTSKIVDKIRIKLEEKHVKYYISPLIETFFDRNNYAGDSSIEESFSDCTSKECHFLYNGKIAICPRPFAFKRVESQYGIDDDILENDMIDIYDCNINGDYINERMSKPAKTCRYCYPQNQLKYFKWQSSIN